MRKNYLLTGGNGRLGTELRKLDEFMCPNRNELELTNLKQLKNTIDKLSPSLIVHAAAYTNVAVADQDPQEAIKCFNSNVIGTKNLVTASTCPIIHISTESVIHPCNFYSLTKLQSELEMKKHFSYTIIRTGMRPRPFPYDVAPYDMWTIGDYIDIIAKKIHQVIELPCQNETIYVGTGIKSVYDLASQSRDDVKKVSYKDVPFPLAPMDELLTIREVCLDQ